MSLDKKRITYVVQRSSESVIASTLEHRHLPVLGFCLKSVSLSLLVLLS